MRIRLNFLLIAVLSLTGAIISPIQVNATPRPQDTIVTLTIVNETGRTICQVYSQPVGIPDQRVERLNHAQIAPGENYELRLPARIYDLSAFGCDNRPVLFVSNLAVSTASTLHVTESDVAAAACYTASERGVQHYYASRYSEALEEYATALACFKAIDHQAGQGDVLSNTGAVYERQGRYGEGIASYLQGLALAQALADDYDESAALNGLATIYDNQARYTEALDNYQKALAIQRKLQNDHGVATLLNNIGVVLVDQHQYAAALQDYKEALNIRDRLGDRRGVGVVLHNLGIAYGDMGKHAEAEQTLAEALAVWRELGDSFNQAQTLGVVALNYARQGRFAEALDRYDQALKIRQAIGDRNGEAHALASKAGIYRDQKRYDEALALYEEAMAALETIRVTSGSESGRAGYISQYASVYSDAIRLYLAQGNNEKAFAVTERGRARAFLDSLSAGRVALTDQETAGLEAQGVALTLAEVQALLDDQTTILSYWVLPSEGALAFIITRAAAPDVVRLPQATPERLLAAISDLYAWPDLETPYPEALRNLRAWLVDPLAAKLKTPRVAIIPHQLLHYVPFSALTDGSRYFGAEHVLFLLPSASALPYIQRNAGRAASGPAQNALVFGDPATDAALPPLPGAADEAREIASGLGAPVYIGADASESRFRSLASHAAVIHLAGHGFYNRASPLHGVVYLAPGDGQDGRLEVQEIYELHLDAAPLVVLSACETNIAELRTAQDIVVSAGDDLVGFTRALFFAGSPTVIASLWPVEDVASRQLMGAFYRYWQDGLGKAEALQLAQDDVRRTRPSPRYWAGFVLSGDPGMMRQQQAAAPAADRRSLAWLIILLVCLAFAGAFAAAGWRRRCLRRTVVAKEG